MDRKECYRLTHPLSKISGYATVGKRERGSSWIFVPEPASSWWRQCSCKERGNCCRSIQLIAPVRRRSVKSLMMRQTTVIRSIQTDQPDVAADVWQHHVRLSVCLCLSVRLSVCWQRSLSLQASCWDQNLDPGLHGSVSVSVLDRTFRLGLKP